MANKTTTNEIFNGTNGAVWIATDSENLKVGSMDKFSLKQTMQYEDVELSEDIIKKRKLTGIELTGEISKFKVDFKMIDIAKKYKDGDQLDIYFIGKVYNNNTGLEQKVKIKGVTLDEIDILNLEQKTPTKESTSFGAEDWEII